MKVQFQVQPMSYLFQNNPFKQSRPLGLEGLVASQ